MSPVFALLVLCAAGSFRTTNAGCAWQAHLKTNAPGGDPQMAVYTADECKAACLNSESATGKKCYAVDHQPANKWCWFFYSTDFKEQASTDMDHYNYVCDAPNPCATSPCRNGGQCNPSGSSYSCVCPSGYTGTNCEIAPNPCATSSPCRNGGQCYPSGASYYCVCPSGYSGTNCEIAPNPCATSNPCKNGGQCNPSGASYYCVCATGFTGTNCDTATCQNRDIFAGLNPANCITTNYPGKSSDLFSSFSTAWSAGLPSVTLDLATNMRSITWQSSTNLAGVRVLYKTSSGDVWSSSVYGNTVDKSVDNVKSFTLFFLPINFQQNVTISGFGIRSCNLSGIWSLLCVVADVLGAVLNTAVSFVSLGLITFDSSGKGTINVGYRPPYIEVTPVNCLGGSGIFEFSQISFGSAQNIRALNIEVWNGYSAVRVTDKDGRSNPLNYYSNGVTLAAGTKGDRLRATISFDPRSFTLDNPTAQFTFVRPVFQIC